MTLYKSDFTMFVFFVPLEHLSRPNKTMLNFLTESCLVVAASAGRTLVVFVVPELGVAAVSAVEELLLEVGLPDGQLIVAVGDWFSFEVSMLI